MLKDPKTTGPTTRYFNRMTWPPKSSCAAARFGVVATVDFVAGRPIDRNVDVPDGSAVDPATSLDVGRIDPALRALDYFEMAEEDDAQKNDEFTADRMAVNKGAKSRS